MKKDSIIDALKKVYGEGLIDEEKYRKVVENLERKESVEVAEIDDLEVIQRKIKRLKEEIDKVVVGQEKVVNSILISLLCDGHALLEGVPGLAKSLLVETLGRTITGTTFRRIQFVPDMLPADILGVNAYNPKTGEFYIVKGPVFANFILADEINRAPPKTQAAMMEVMQERKVNIHEKEFRLEKPFLVLATQNPLEQFGTYPLPEAIVDRFFMKIIVDYPTPEEELEIIDRNTMVNYNIFDKVKPVVDASEIIEMQNIVRTIYISPEVKTYIVSLINTTRGKTNIHIKSLKYVRYGGSPRASISLGLGARAVALMNGRDYVIPDDIKEVAYEILRHRIILNYEGRASGITTDEVISEIMESVGAI